MALPTNGVHNILYLRLLHSNDSDRSRLDSAAHCSEMVSTESAFGQSLERVSQSTLNIDILHNFGHSTLVDIH